MQANIKRITNNLTGRRYKKLMHKQLQIINDKSTPIVNNNLYFIKKEQFVDVLKQNEYEKYKQKEKFHLADIGKYVQKAINYLKNINVFYPTAPIIIIQDLL